MLRRRGGMAARSCSRYVAHRESRVEHRNDTMIGCCAQETARALREDQRRRGEVDRGEGAEAALFGACASGCVHRLVGRRERDPVDGNEHARCSDRIDPGPERSRSDENGGFVLDERLREPATFARPLLEDVVVGPLAQELREVFDVRVRRAQDERSATCRVDQVTDAVACLFEPRVSRPTRVG